MVTYACLLLQVRHYTCQVIYTEIHQKHELLEKSMKGNESSKTAR